MNLASIRMETLRQWMEKKQPVVVLDVRPTEQRDEWSIPGSLHINAYEALKAGDPLAMASFSPPSDQRVVTVCALGRMSALAAQQLRERGYQAFSLEGGMKAWSEAWNTAEVRCGAEAACVLQVRRTGKGCLSYLIGSRGRAAVIDASVAAEVYLELAGEAGWKISEVLETHIHADHLSRSRRLAELSGATLRLPQQERVNYPFTPVREGDRINLGNTSLTALHTPGHSQESVCYRLNSDALFTGDTLFLASVGRPDLDTGAHGARRRARQLCDSLQRLLALPSDTLILPGHTGRPVPFDGSPLCARLEEISSHVPQLRFEEEDFVAWVLGRIPPTPPNHRQIVYLNEQGVSPPGDPTDLEAGANRCAVW